MPARHGVARQTPLILKVALLADAVSFAEPRQQLGIELLKRTQAERVDVAAGGEGFDPREEEILRPPGCYLTRSSASVLPSRRWMMR